MLVLISIYIHQSFRKSRLFNNLQEKGRYSFKKKSWYRHRTLTKSKYLKRRSLSILKNSDILNLNKFIIKHKIWGEY